MSIKRVGILALHGDISEHLEATKKAAKKLNLNVKIVPVRTKEEIKDLDGLIIPGGESTTIHKLCVRENMFADLKKIKNIFGTCAGAILLSKIIHHKTPEQKSLELMDIEINRNGYGRQTDSFEQKIKTKLGSINAIFIRAPRIIKIGKKVNILAQINSEIIACEQKANGKYYLACCFHPELSGTIFHEKFIKEIYGTFPSPYFKFKNSPLIP